MDLALAILITGVALFAGVGGYLVLLRDLGRRRAVWAGVGSAIIVTASFLFVVYLAVIAFIAAAGVYLLLRTRLRVAHALIAMGTTLGGLLAASVLVFSVSLTYSM